MRASSQTRELIANRPFVVLLSARTVAMLGMGFAPVALAFGVLGLPGADAGTLSIVLAAQSIPLIVFMLIGGVVADRHPRAIVLRSGLVGAGLAWGSVGLMLLSGYAPIWLLCVSTICAGVSGAAVYPALTGIIPDLVPSHLLQEGNAWLSMGASAARFAGLVASGAVVVWLGGGWAMVVAGSLYLVAAVLAGMLPTESTLASSGDNPLRQLREGWGEFRSRRWLWVCVLQWSILWMVLQASIGVLGPVIANAELGGAASWTFVLAGEAFGAIVGVGLAMIWRPRRPILVGTLLTFFAAAPLLLLGWSFPLWMVVAAAFFTGLGFDLFGVLWMTTMQREVPAESLSRVASYDALGSLMLAPIGLMLAGPAAQLFGVHASLIGAGVISIGTTVFALAFPEVRRLTAPKNSRAEVAEAA